MSKPRRKRRGRYSICETNCDCSLLVSSRQFNPLSLRYCRRLASYENESLCRVLVDSDYKSLYQTLDSSSPDWCERHECYLHFLSWKISSLICLLFVGFTFVFYDGMGVLCLKILLRFPHSVNISAAPCLDERIWPLSKIATF